MYDGDDDALAKDLELQVSQLSGYFIWSFPKINLFFMTNSAILGCNHECKPFYHFAQHIFLG
jgi:hypothetical protein